VPWSVFKEFRANADMTLGFDVMVNARTADGEMVHLTWHGTPKNTTDPSGFGTALLVPYRTVAYEAPVGESTLLAGWHWGHETSKLLVATHHARGVEAPLIVFGPSTRLSDNVHENTSGIGIKGFPQGSERDEQSYIAWTLTPQPGTAISPEEVVIALWNTGHHPFQGELRVSQDGFETFSRLELQGLAAVTRTGLASNAGVPLKVALDDPNLRRLARPVEFRLYLWGAQSPHLGLGKHGEWGSKIGLQVVGTLERN
jgi:hypothetical protein